MLTKQSNNLSIWLSICCRINLVNSVYPVFNKLQSIIADFLKAGSLWYKFYLVRFGCQYPLKKARSLSFISLENLRSTATSLPLFERMARPEFRSVPVSWAFAKVNPETFWWTPWGNWTFVTLFMLWVGRWGSRWYFALAPCLSIFLPVRNV